MTETDARYRHASGEDGGCVACLDPFNEGDEPYQCRHPEPDPDDPGLCRFCSHTVERVA